MTQRLHNETIKENTPIEKSASERRIQKVKFLLVSNREYMLIFKCLTS